MDILDIASVDARYYYALPECFGKRWSWIWELLWVDLWDRGVDGQDVVGIITID